MSITLTLPKYNNNIIEVEKNETLTELDERPYVVETYTSGTKWYRIWSDGWCEQGNTATVCNNTTTFLVAYIDTNYTLTGPSFVIADVGGQYVTKYTTGFKATSSNKNCTVYSWYACGYTS